MRKTGERLTIRQRFEVAVMLRRSWLQNRVENGQIRAARLVPRWLKRWVVVNAYVDAGRAYPTIPAPDLRYEHVARGL